MACCIRPSGATVEIRAQIRSYRQVSLARSCRSIRRRLRIHWQLIRERLQCSVSSGLLAVPRASVPLHFSRTPLPIRESCGWSNLVPLSRSEEHTSELQSHVNLVCRLPLEKTKPSETAVTWTHTQFSRASQVRTVPRF